MAAQMYDLVKTYRGKTEVVMTDTQAKVKAKKRSLETSQRKGIKGYKVSYAIKESEADKKAFVPKSEAWRAGGYAQNPARVGR